MTAALHTSMNMDAEIREHVVELCRRRNIIIPTFAQLQDPARLVPPEILEELKSSRHL